MKYVGIKILENAKVMTLGKYNKYRGWDMPTNEDPKKKGYMVEYEADENNKPNDDRHKGYISWSPKEVFEKAYTPFDSINTKNKIIKSKLKTIDFKKQTTIKTLGNTDTHGAKENVKDIVFFGNGDMFKLISKASSKNEGWMKSTKAMYIPGRGCVVQMTTQQWDNIAETSVFVPNVKIVETLDADKKVIGRSLIKTKN